MFISFRDKNAFKNSTWIFLASFCTFKSNWVQLEFSVYSRADIHYNCIEKIIFWGTVFIVFPCSSLLPNPCHINPIQRPTSLYGSCGKYGQSKLSGQPSVHGNALSGCWQRGWQGSFAAAGFGQAALLWVLAQLCHGPAGLVLPSCVLSWSSISCWLSQVSGMCPVGLGRASWCGRGSQERNVDQPSNLVMLWVPA